MYYTMNYDIKIGDYRLRLIDSVNISSSVENLAGTAVITLPGAYINRAIQIEEKIREGDPVEIRLGYDSSLLTEFKGYVNAISTDDGSIKIECEDALYLFRKPLRDGQLNNASLKTVLDTVVRQIDPSIRIDCDFSFGYEKFTIFKATGYDVLKKIQEETHADVYFADGTLHLHPPYSRILNEKPVVFDFSHNVEKSDLKYVKASQKKIEIEVIFTSPDGKRKSKTFGQSGGLKETVISRAATDEAGAAKIAENQYNRVWYDGYEGGFTGWLLPFVEPAGKVEIRDAQYPYKNGIYYVTGTEVAFSSSGGSRTIKTGRRI